MTRILTDTNILLHGKPLQDIPWDRYEKPPITVVVTKTNIRELDRHKDQHPKKHMRDRARRALKQIEQSLASPILRANVKLEVEHRSPKVDFEQYDLDPEHPDDTIIASALQSSRDHPDEVTVLYSHDVGPRITAQRVGLAVRELPESERLPAEKDEAEVESARLRRELHELRAAAPELSLLIEDEENTVNRATHGSPSEPQTDEEIASQVAAALQEFPAIDPDVIPKEEDGIRRRDDGRRVLVIDPDAPRLDPGGVPRSELLRYERERESYGPLLAKYLRERHAALVARSRVVTLDFTLWNKGGQPADDIHVDIEVPEYWSSSESGIPLPQAPAKPRSPRSRGELLRESVANAAVIPSFSGSDFYRGIPDINPRKSGPRIDGQNVRWWVRSLKHGFTTALGAFNIIAREKVVPCRVSYKIHAANAVKPFEGSILVRPHDPRASVLE
jgi:hypothetical protein